MSTNDQTAAEATRNHPPFLIEISVFVAAVIGRMPALGAWWNLDDWGQLGRSAGMAGLTEAAGFPARWLSQYLWWDLTWPLFGLNSDAHAVARLMLHGLSAVLVTRIGARAGLGVLPRLMAGLLFAASPLAFTPLYWASGIQELLGAFFALLAVERWLAAGAGDAGSRRALLMACVATILSMLAKESGLGLPFLFLVMMWLGIGVRLKDKAFAWAMVMFMLLAAVAEGVLVMNHFAADTTGTYAIGDIPRVLINACVYGWWLMSPSPVLTSEFNYFHLLPSSALFAAWMIWGVIQWRRGRKLVLLALVATMLSLGPALLLKDRFEPYLAYTAAAAGALALVSLLPARWSPRYPVLIVLTIAATIWGFTGMRIRLANRNELDLISHPVVRATSLSWQACRTMLDLKQVQGGYLRYLTIFQQPVTPARAEQAERFGERWVSTSHLYAALQGKTGPELVMGPDVTVVWASGLTTSPPGALVVCETATGLRVWGNTWNALLYAGLTDIGLGHFERARRHLVKASTMNKEMILFIFDEGQMVIPLAWVVRNKEGFVDWTVSLLNQGASPHEVGGLQDMFFNLLSSCTGRSIGDLTTGSHLISGSETDLGNDKEGE